MPQSASHPKAALWQKPAAPPLSPVHEQLRIQLLHCCKRPCRVGQSTSPLPLACSSKCPCRAGEVLRIELANPSLCCSRQGRIEFLICPLHCCKCPCRGGEVLCIELANPSLCCSRQGLEEFLIWPPQCRKCPCRVGELLRIELANRSLCCSRQGRVEFLICPLHCCNALRRC